MTSDQRRVLYLICFECKESILMLFCNDFQWWICRAMCHVLQKYCLLCQCCCVTFIFVPLRLHESSASLWTIPSALPPLLINHWQASSSCPQGSLLRSYIPFVTSTIRPQVSDSSVTLNRRNKNRTSGAHPYANPCQG